MTSPLHPSQGDGGANGSTEAARAHEAVAHGRAHLDYQRRVAAAGVDGHNLGVMSVGEWHARLYGKPWPLGGYATGIHSAKDDRW